MRNCTTAIHMQIHPQPRFHCSPSSSFDQYPKIVWFPVLRGLTSVFHEFSQLSGPSFWKPETSPASPASSGRHDGRCTQSDSGRSARNQPTGHQWNAERASWLTWKWSELEHMVGITSGLYPGSHRFSWVETETGAKDANEPTRLQLPQRSAGLCSNVAISFG